MTTHDCPIQKKGTESPNFFFAQSCRLFITDNFTNHLLFFCSFAGGTEYYSTFIMGKKNKSIPGLALRVEGKERRG